MLTETVAPANEAGARDEGAKPSDEPPTTLETLALRAALESIPGEAFVLRVDGTIEHTNGAGRLTVESEPARIRRILSEATTYAKANAAAPPEGCSVTVLREPGLPTRCLVVLERPTDELEWRALAAARRWSLTPRQTEVLVQLARGEPNKGIAHSLGCSPHTVEVHVSAILERAGASSRFALMAKLFSP